MAKASKAKSKAAPATGAKQSAAAKQAKGEKLGKKAAAKPGPTKPAKPAKAPAKAAAKPAPRPAAKPAKSGAVSSAATKPVKSAKPAAPANKAGAGKPAVAKAPPKPLVAVAAPPAAAVVESPVASQSSIVPLTDANGENRPRPRGLSAMGKAKKPKPKKIELEMPKFESIYKTGRKPAPLIASGPKNPAQYVTGPGIKDGEKIKPVFNKRDLDKYRQILVRKRAELAGDVESMESEALNQTSGGLSHTPQHVAEQGSDTFDQDNSLRLAQKERELIKEIDDAIKRVDAGSYGVCELMRKPITLERLTELPWTRYCIEGARILERQRSIPGGVAR